MAVILYFGLCNTSGKRYIRNTDSNFKQTSKQSAKQNKLSNFIIKGKISGKIKVKVSKRGDPQVWILIR